MRKQKRENSSTSQGAAPVVAFRKGLLALALMGCGAAATAEPVQLEIIHSGFSDGAEVTIRLWGEDSNGDGLLVSVPATPPFLDSTGGALIAGDEVWRAEISFPGNSVIGPFETVFDRTRYWDFNNYFTVFNHFSYDLEGGPIIGDGEDEGYVLGQFDNAHSVAIGQKGLTANGFRCELAGFPPADCGMLQEFTQFEDPFDPSIGNEDFGQSTAKVRRVLRGLGRMRPGVSGNRLSPGADTVFWMAVQSTPQIAMDRIDPETVRAGRGEAAPKNWFRPDLDGDGVRDLMMLFNARETGAACGDEAMTLYGLSFDDTIKVEAEDVLTVVNCP